MHWFFHLKLVQDFGVSALALSMVLSLMSVGAIILVMRDKQEFALAWVGALALLAKSFYDGYIAYKMKKGDDI